MQFSVVFLIAVVVAVAVAEGPSKDAAYKTVKSDYSIDPAGSYRFGFETENAIVRDEVGELRTLKNEEGHDTPVVVVRGSYSHPDADGKPLTVTYFADETGYHAEGLHLPVAPVV